MTAKKLGGSLASFAMLVSMASAPALAQDSNPIRFTAAIDGVQSVAINSTALETRTGSGSAVVFFDLASGDLSYEIEFSGLIAEDITLGDPAVNPDGTTPAPGTINGNAVDGAGLTLVHFHVATEAINGPIPIDVIARNGPAIGVTSTTPDPILGATAGRIVGRVNVFDLATNGVLLNGVPVDGRDDAIGDAACRGCGFIEALLENDVYVIIHTRNNPFGEIRGQVLLSGCNVPINTLEGLRTATRAIESSSTARSLGKRLDGVEKALLAGKSERAKILLGEFVDGVASRRTLNRVDALEASNLICGAANVVQSIAGGLE